MILAGQLIWKMPIQTGLDKWNNQMIHTSKPVQVSSLSASPSPAFTQVFPPLAGSGSLHSLTARLITGIPGVWHVAEHALHSDQGPYPPSRCSPTGSLVVVCTSGQSCNTHKTNPFYDTVNNQKTPTEKCMHALSQTHIISLGHCSNGYQLHGITLFYSVHTSAISNWIQKMLSKLPFECYRDDWSNTTKSIVQQLTKSVNQISTLFATLFILISSKMTLKPYDKNLTGTSDILQSWYPNSSCQCQPYPNINTKNLKPSYHIIKTRRRNSKANKH